MIIKSLLDLDFYKLTMCQFAWKYYPKVKLTYKFFNRTSSIKLGNLLNIEFLKKEIESIRNLKFTEDELDYLSKYFQKDFIEYLKHLKLPEVEIKNIDGNLDIKTTGKWSDAILWETIILSLVNELYYLSKYQDQSKLIEMGTNKNFIKYKALSEMSVKFADFGTRRRFSGAWQKGVVEMMKSLPNFIGTSNTLLAKTFDLKPIGTNAHELYMVIAGLNRYNN